MLGKLKAWYRGTYVPPPENDPNSAVVFISLGHYEQPPLAKLLRSAGRFYIEHWKWIFGAAGAIVAFLLKGR